MAKRGPKPYWVDENGRVFVKSRNEKLHGTEITNMTEKEVRLLKHRMYIYLYRENHPDYRKTKSTVKS